MPLVDCPSDGALRCTGDFPKSSLRRCQRGRIPREISQGINHLRYAQSSELKGEV